MSTLKVCLIIASIATGGFGAVAGAVSMDGADRSDENFRLCAMLFLGVTRAR